MFNSTAQCLVNLSGVPAPTGKLGHARRAPHQRRPQIASNRVRLTLQEAQRSAAKRPGRVQRAFQAHSVPCSDPKDAAELREARFHFFRLSTVLWKH